MPKGEKKIENKIKDYLFREGHYFFKVHGSAFMEKGIPDIVSCINGRFVGIEVKDKNKKNTQSESQKVHQRNIEKASGVYLLVDDFEDFKEELYEKDIIDR